LAICNHRDLDYKKACCDAYNRWIAAYCAAHPDRLLGIGQTAMRTPEEGIRDLESIRGLGLRGVMMPGHPGVEDYDSAVYDPFWEAAIGIGLPVSFHILTTRDRLPRGPRMNAFLSVVRGCQDIMGMLVLGGVFERHPRLRVVCVEAAREDDEPAGEAVRPLLHEPDHVGPEEAAEVPQRIDERDRTGRGAPAREASRRRPERPERAPHAERRERQRGERHERGRDA